MPLVTEPMGTSSFRPSGKEWLKDVPAHLPVKFADAIDLPAATDSEVGHVEVRRRVAVALPSHRQQVVHGDGQLIFCVVA